MAADASGATQGSVWLGYVRWPGSLKEHITGVQPQSGCFQPGRA